MYATGLLLFKKVVIDVRSNAIVIVTSTGRTVNDVVFLHMLPGQHA